MWICQRPSLGRHPQPVGRPGLLQKTFSIAVPSLDWIVLYSAAFLTSPKDRGLCFGLAVQTSPWKGSAGAGFCKFTDDFSILFTNGTEHAAASWMPISFETLAEHIHNRH